MTTNEPKIMHDSPEAAWRVTVSGWVSSKGHFFGDNDTSERIARYDGSTHAICECGNERSKSWTVCDDCRRTNDIARYLDKEFKVWSGEPVYSESLDRYFFSEGELLDYCQDEDIEVGGEQLVICDPVCAKQIDDDYWCDDLPEDTYLNDAAPEIAEALEVLNKLIRDKKVVLSWYPGKFRTAVS